MKKRHNIGIIGLTALGLWISCTSPSPTISQEEATSANLFMQGADDWFEKGDATWTFENSELTGNAASGEGFVMTKQTYRNFELKMEFHPDDTINSGVFIRCGEHLINDTNCYEINIWDRRPEQNYRTGAIVSKAEPLVHMETIDRWNTYRIKCEDDHLLVWLNDTLTADFHDTSFIEGHIGLQAHGAGQIRFRNVTITSLD